MSLDIPFYRTFPSSPLIVQVERNSSVIALLAGTLNRSKLSYLYEPIPISDVDACRNGEHILSDSSMFRPEFNGFCCSTERSCPDKVIAARLPPNRTTSARRR
jgi:hypothetical protein